MMRRVLALLAVGVVAIALAGCGSSKTDSQSVSQRLQSAKTSFDNSAAIQFTLSGPGISATGCATHQPAFEGTITQPVSMDIRAIGSQVWVKGSIFGPAWSQQDLSRFGAPNPADVMSTTNGISSLLTAATGLKATTKRVPNTNTEVTSITGTVTGDLVNRFIPVADATASFAVTFSLDSGSHLTAASITGPFSAKGASNTYSLTISDCPNTQPITPPTP